jgi:hypothetical protein
LLVLFRSLYIIPFSFDGVLFMKPSVMVAGRDELQEYDPFDEGVFCRSRFWLFISYVVSFASVAGAVWVLLGHYALNPDVTNVWPGVAGLFQVKTLK